MAKKKKQKGPKQTIDKSLEESVTSEAEAEAQPQPQAQTQRIDKSLEESANPAAAEVSEEKEIAEAEAQAATQTLGQVLKAAAKAEAERATAKAKVAREAAEAEARESEQAEKAKAAREAAEAKAEQAEKNGKNLARQVGLTMRAAGAGAGGAAETQAEQRQKETAKAEQATKVAARERATTAPKKQAATKRQTREEIAVAHITQIYLIARSRELFQCLQFLRSNRWPEEKENHGNMAKEADEKLIEMILHARANPNSRTAKVFREQYQFDVNTVAELQKESSQLQESDHKKQEIKSTLINAYKEAVKLEKEAVAEFLTKHKEAIEEEIEQGSLITSSKFKNVDGNKIQLSQIIDHTRESRLIRWLLSWLPIPGCFYSGARSYGLFKANNIDTRDSTNRQKPSAKIAAEMLVERKARSAA